jgi:hypothetical protein
MCKIQSRCVLLLLGCVITAACQSRSCWVWQLHPACQSLSVARPRPTLRSTQLSDLIKPVSTPILGPVIDKSRHRWQKKNHLPFRNHVTCSYYVATTELNKQNKQTNRNHVTPWGCTYVPPRPVFTTHVSYPGSMSTLNRVQHAIITWLCLPSGER